MSRNKELGVIILGGHVQGYGIVKVFGEIGVPSVVIERNKKNLAKHSKYCIRSHVCSYDEVIDLLIKFKKENKYHNWLLFPTDDYYVKTLSIHKDRIDDYYFNTVPSWDIINKVYNKWNAYEIVKSIVVPIPKTLIATGNLESQIESADITFPCILKPVVMLDFYRNFKKKVFVCNSISELKDNLRIANYYIPSDQMLVQEIIYGNSFNQYSVGVFYFNKKRINTVVARRKRQHPPDFGNATTFAETVKNDLLVDYTDRILSEIDYFGICEVEFKYDSSDKVYKFMEVNPRTWKWHILADKAGVPLLQNIYNYFHKQTFIPDKSYKDTSWQDVITDTFIRLKYLNKEHTKDLNNCVQAVFNLKDIKPFIMQIIYILHYFFNR